MSKWLSKNEYARIRRKAKKMGATDVQFKYIMHDAWFPHATVSFAFYPLRYNVSIPSKHNLCGHFSTKEEAEAIKRDIDIALGFIEYLKEFNAQLPESEDERK